MKEYQVFIAFKNVDQKGNRTPESYHAETIYEFLTQNGLKVFNSNITLEKRGIGEYKKSIDEALDMAKILIAVGTSKENLDSEWVRYEWDSFYTDILRGIKPEGRVFTYIDQIEPNQLPRTLRQTQSIKHSNDSLEHLYCFVINALNEPDRGTSTLKKDYLEKTDRLEAIILKKISGEGPPIISVPFGSTFRIGKKRGNDIILTGKGISRYHADLEYGAEGLLIHDRGSTNGTFVNTERIVSKELKKDDVIEFDIIKFQVC